MTQLCTAKDAMKVSEEKMTQERNYQSFFPLIQKPTPPDNETDGEA